MHKPIVFYVADTPKPGGSKKGFTNPKTGRVVIVDDCAGNKGWRLSVQVAAKQAYDGPLLVDALKVLFTFFVQHPKGHYGTGKNASTLKASAPRYPTTKPDVLKLARSTEDALTGVIWMDDSSTVNLELRKRYCEPGQRPGVQILIAPMK